VMITGDNHRTAKAIAERCSASERGTRILCDFLTIIGFLTKEGNNYELTADSAITRIFCTVVYVGTGRSRTIFTRGTFARCFIRRSEFCQYMAIPLKFAWSARTAESMATPLRIYNLSRELSK